MNGQYMTLDKVRLRELHRAPRRLIVTMLKSGGLLLELWLGGGKKEYMRNFPKETLWNTLTCKTEEEMNIFKMDLWRVGCGNEKYLELTQDRTLQCCEILLKAVIVKPAQKAVAREQHGNNMPSGVFYAVGTAFPQQQVCTQQ
jgi:hypothetical protein